MIRLFIAMCVIGFVVPACAETSRTKIKVEKVDPKKTVGTESDSCTIFFQDGKPYKVCPFSIPEDVKAAIREQEVQ